MHVFKVLLPKFKGLPENADKIMNSIDRPEIIIIKTTTSIKLIK